MNEKLLAEQSVINRWLDETQRHAQALDNIREDFGELIEPVRTFLASRPTGFEGARNKRDGVTRAVGEFILKTLPDEGVIATELVPFVHEITGADGSWTRAALSSLETSGKVEVTQDRRVVKR